MQRVGGLMHKIDDVKIKNYRAYYNKYKLGCSPCIKENAGNQYDPVFVSCISKKVIKD